MIDTHTHLNFIAFKTNWHDVVERAVKSGVRKMIVVGTDLETSQQAVEMAQKHPVLYAAVGIHPHHARAYARASSNLKSQISNQELKMKTQSLATEIANDVNKLKQLAQQSKVVAIGEVGLDHHLYKNTKYEIQDTAAEWELITAIQKELLSQQIQLAQELDKPLILHSREVGEDVLDMLTSSKSEIRSTKSETILQTSNKLQKVSNFELSASNFTPKGVFHCYDGSKKYLKKIIAAGLYVSFTGNITFVPDRLEVANQVPLDRLLIETDSPYMTPAPHRGQTNEPANVKLVAEAHAAARGIPLDEVISQTSENAATLFSFN